MDLSGSGTRSVVLRSKGCTFFSRSIKSDFSWTSWGTTRFSRRILLYVVE